MIFNLTGTIDDGETITWQTPSIITGYVSIINGGYYVKGKHCYVQIRVQPDGDIPADSGRNVMSGLPIPAEVGGVPLSILVNNRGGHGARVTNGGAIQLIADVDHLIADGTNVDIAGVYTIQ